MRISNELQIGKAGEYLVCADLILKGLIAYPSEQGLPYDIVCDNGSKLIRVQVKTTTGPRIIPQRSKDSYAYIFGIRRHGKNHQAIYGSNEVDVFALVCIDTKKVGYLKNSEMPTTVNFRVDSLRGSYYDEKGIKDYKNVTELYKTIKNQSEIARMLNLQIAVVNRMLQKEYIPYQTNAKYFSDIEREKEWFYEL